MLFITILLSFIAVSQIQSSPNRYPNQVCFEDSLDVFWTYYPNPFSPPTVKDTGVGFINLGLTYYCDLSDSVEVALIGSNDSIVYSAIIISPKSPHFDVAYWVAGPKVSKHSLPANYFRGIRDENLKLLLIVDGRWKSRRERGIQVKKGWYYWIDNSNTN